MREFLKRHWLLILLAAAAVVLASIWFLARTQVSKPSEIEPGTIEEPSSRFLQKAVETTFTIAIPAPQLPDEVELLETRKVTRGNLAEIYSPVFADLGLNIFQNPRETALGALVWDTDSSSLLINLPSGRFVYSGGIKKAAFFDTQQAQVLANSLANRWKLLDSVTPIRTILLERIGNHIFETKKASEAEIFSVIAGATIKGLPVAAAAVGLEVIEFRLTRDGELTSLNFDLHLPGDSKGKVKIKNWEEAVADLNAGKGQALWVKDLQGNPAATPDQSPILKATVAASYLAYFESGEEEQSVYQPIYVFEGQGVNSDNQNILFSIFVPAIPQELFLP